MADRIHIEVQNKNCARIDYPQSVTKPSVFPSFVLVFDHGWNDYAIRTLFYLYFFDEDERIHPIGEVKLMSCGDSNTKEVLPESFDKPLGNEFCSLGQTPEYYQSIHHLFSDKPDILSKLMVHLRDCAYSPKIREQFDADDTFNTSLIRDLNAEKALRLGKCLLNGITPDEAYSFTYKFCIPEIQRFNYSWNVEFKYELPGFARTKCLIGENGVGKTLLLANLAKDLVTSNIDRFKPNVPLFGSCMSICSTPLDRFDFDEQHLRIQYQNCSLSQERDTDDKLIRLLEKILQRPTVKKISMREKSSSLFYNILETLNFCAYVSVKINNRWIAPHTSHGTDKLFSLLFCQ